MTLDAGQIFGRLTVQPESEMRGTRRYWKCVCQCGGVVWAPRNNLVAGCIQSCGCLRREMVAKRNHVHGFAHTPTGNAWRNMIQRCYLKSLPTYSTWGGRGIRVCEFLRTSPVNLVMVIGLRPAPNLTLDREDNDGHYSCGSCAECMEHGWPLNIRWITQKEQMRNLRKNVIISVDGRLQCMSAWAEEIGVPQQSFKRHNALRKLRLAFPSATIDFA